MARVGPRTGARIAVIAGTVACAVCLLAPAIPPLASSEQGPRSAPHPKFLAGQLLIAAPDMSDPRFEESVIYMVAHDEQGAFGLIINKVLSVEPVSKLRFEGEPPIESSGRTIRIHFGGPVDFGRGFVLHTPDYVGLHTVMVDDVFAMTPGEDTDLMRALAKGEGPRKSILALGYAGWSPGQLESELDREAWVTATTDEAFVFDEDFDGKWRRAYDRREITL
ncbi:MAG: YqgE/AlgH family protein [Alphaproteobacteria bacterium]|nr:YqgE/AlgH family protein [Alphaproteobacteria bacterium]